MNGDVIESIETFNPGSHALFDVIVEIPKGTKNECEMDHLTGRIRLDRILFTSTQHPHDYGSTEGILGPDGDPPDATVIGAEPTFPGCLIQCHAMAIPRTADETGGDDKALCVSTASTCRRHLKNLDSVAEHILLEIEYFLSVYKDLEPGKFVEGAIWAGRKKAEEEIIASIRRAGGIPFEYHRVNPV